MKKIYIVRSENQYATIGFSFMSSSFRELAKPYYSRWRARYRAWRMNCGERDYLRGVTGKAKWYIEEVEVSK